MELGRYRKFVAAALALIVGGAVLWFGPEPVKEAVSTAVWALGALGVYAVSNEA